MTAKQRRPYGTGSIYQRSSDGRWYGSYEAGWNANGTRRRPTVSAKTEGAVKRKLRDAIAAQKRGDVQTRALTVKAWADQYLEMRVRDLSPKAYNAAANPIRNWVVPTIGHRRLDQLTPADVRAVHQACRDADRGAGDVHRVLKTMFNTAVTEGHHINPAVLKVKAPKSDGSDRAAMTVDQGIACLEQAALLPHGVRWVFTLLYGARLGESLGMTWDAIDLAAGEARIEWQLQALPYNVARDRTSGFRVPDGYEARHLIDAYHLVRPKSAKGWRVAPLLPGVTDGLNTWRTIAPDNPYGLVWPEPNGRPRTDKHDRAEWHAIQARAQVAHPAGRPFHIHETRSFAATMLFEAGVPEHVITDLLGHSSIVTSLRYRTVRREPLLEAMEKVGRRLQLGG
jgi:integrase